MMLTNLTIERIVSAGYDQVAYLVRRPGAAEVVVVDPGYDSEALLGALRREGLRVAAILNTHGHTDHIAGNAAVKAAFPDAPLIVGRNEVRLLADPSANLSAAFGEPLTSPPADRTVADGETLELAGLRLEVREVPGHSPGSVVFVLEATEPDPAVVLGGDVLFAGSVGRCDLPGGDLRRLLRGIRAKLLSLPDATIVLPGHGPATTVGRERRENPYLAG